METGHLTPSLPIGIPPVRACVQGGGEKCLVEWDGIQKNESEKILPLFFFFSFLCVCVFIYVFEFPINHE